MKYLNSLISLTFLIVSCSRTYSPTEGEYKEPILFQDTTRNIYSSLLFDKSNIYYINYDINKEEFLRGIYEYNTDLFLTRYSNSSIRKYSYSLYLEGFVESLIQLNDNDEIVYDSRFIELNVDTSLNNIIRGRYFENRISIDSTLLFDKNLNLLAKDSGEFVIYNDLKVSEYYFLQTRIFDSINNATFLGNIMFSPDENDIIYLNQEKIDHSKSIVINELYRLLKLRFKDQLKTEKIRKSNLFSILIENGYQFKSINNLERNPFLKLKRIISENQ